MKGDVERFGTHSGGSMPISIKNEGLLVFQGDGKSDMQVFDIDLEAINAVYDEKGYSGWLLNFEGILDNAHVIVNCFVPGGPKLAKGLVASPVVRSLCLAHLVLTSRPKACS